MRRCSVWSEQYGEKFQEKKVLKKAFEGSHDWGLVGSFQGVCVGQLTMP